MADSSWSAETIRSHFAVVTRLSKVSKCRPGILLRLSYDQGSVNIHALSTLKHLVLWLSQPACATLRQMCEAVGRPDEVATPVTFSGMVS